MSSSQGIPAPPLRSIEKIIRSESNLPAPVSGEIFLDGDTPYKFENTITLDSGEFITVGARTSIIGHGRGHSILTGDVAGELIRIPTNADTISIERLSIVQSNAGGDGLRAVDSTLERLLFADCELTLGGSGDAVAVGANRFSMREVTISGFARALVPNRGGATYIVDGSLMTQADGGSGNRVVDLGSNVWSAVYRLSNTTLLSAAGGFSLGMLANSGNLSGVGRGTLQLAGIIGAGGDIENGTIDDLAWEYIRMRGIQDSRTVGGFAMNNNTVDDTVIVTQNVFVKVAGVTVATDERRITHVPNNQLTIDALDDDTYIAHASLSVTKSGGSVRYGFAIFVNGSQIGPTFPREVSGTLGNVSFVIPFEGSAGDDVDIRARNEEGTQDFIARAMALTLNEG